MLKAGWECSRDSLRSVSNHFIKQLKLAVPAPCFSICWERSSNTDTHTETHTHHTHTYVSAGCRSIGVLWEASTKNPLHNPTFPRPLNSPENRPALYPPYLDDCARDKCSTLLCVDSYEHTSCSSYRARTPCKFSSSAEAAYGALMSTLHRCFFPRVFSTSQYLPHCLSFLYLTLCGIRCRVFSNENRRNTCLQTAIWSGYGGLCISALTASMSVEIPFQKPLCCGIVSWLRGDNETSFLHFTAEIWRGTAGGSVQRTFIMTCLSWPTWRPFFKAEESHGATFWQRAQFQKGSAGQSAAEGHDLDGNWLVWNIGASPAWKLNRASVDT